MNEEQENDRDTTGMSATPEQQHVFDTTGHLTNTALNESLDGSLPDQATGLVRGHLTGCDACASRRAELAQTISLVRSLPAVEPGRTFEIAPSPERAPTPQTKSWFQGVLSPSFPALRVAVAAVFLLLAGVTTADLVTQRDDQPDQVAMVADTPAARSDSVSMQAPPATQPLPAAPQDQIEAVESEDVLRTEPSEALSEPAADSESDMFDADQTEDASADPTQAQPPTPQPSPSATAAPPEERADASDESDGLSNWRIAEIALLLLLFWLIVTWLGLERIKKR